MATEFNHIDADALAELLKNGNTNSIKIVDVRGEEFSAAHIKGAINYEVSTLENPSVLDELVKEVASAQTVVVHCQLSKVRGPKAAALLAERLKSLAGAKPELAVLRGGFEQFGSLYSADPQLVEGIGAAAVNGEIHGSHL